MTQYIGQGVSLEGLEDQKYRFTWLVSGTVVAGTDEGKAVVQDTATANTVKLADGGLRIIGVLKAYENRIQEGIKVGTIAHKGFFVVPYTGTAPAIGDRVIASSATLGSVLGSTAAAASGFVCSVDTSAVTLVLALGIW